MDNDARTKSEPPLTQQEEANKSALKQMSSEGAERPPSAQQHQKFTSDEHADEQDDIETEDEELHSDPAEAIADFDWEDLMLRYHRAMDDCTGEEGKLAEEWESLMNVGPTSYAHID